MAAIKRPGLASKTSQLYNPIIDNCSSDDLSPFMESNVDVGGKVETDGWKGYRDLKSLGYEHRQIPQSLSDK